MRLVRNVVTLTPRVGRALLYEIVPDGIPFELIKRPWATRTSLKLINLCYRSVGLKETVIFADQLMYMGYEYSTVPVSSIGVEDFVIPRKQRSLDSAEDEIREIESQFASGLVTQGETLQQGHRHLDACQRHGWCGHDGHALQRNG